METVNISNIISINGNIKTNIRFHGSMPHILNDIINIALKFNILHPRTFEPGMRCISFAFDGSKLIEYGINKRKTHPFTKNYHDLLHTTQHAEADMVMKLLKKQNLNLITDIIVIRGSKKPLNSHPCSICSGLFDMYFTNIRLWFFDSDHMKWKCEIIDKIN